MEGQRGGQPRVPSREYFVHSCASGERTYQNLIRGLARLGICDELLDGLP